MPKARASIKISEKPTPIEPVAAEGKKRKEGVKKTVARVLGKASIMEEEEEVHEEEIRIEKTKHFDMKPMYPEDACLEMELLGHSFYMFLNAETDQISVVYKRKGNSYGLIEPET